MSIKQGKQMSALGRSFWLGYWGKDWSRAPSLDPSSFIRDRLPLYPPTVPILQHRTCSPGSISYTWASRWCRRKMRKMLISSPLHIRISDSSHILDPANNSISLSEKPPFLFLLVSILTSSTYFKSSSPAWLLLFQEIAYRLSASNQLAPSL